MKGIPTEARKLMDLYANTARTTESEATAEANISILVGMIGYASVRGDITPAQHAAEWALIRLIRDERAAARQPVAA